MIKNEKQNYRDAKDEESKQRADGTIEEENNQPGIILEYKILYEGSLPRDSQGSWNSNILHRCTMSLIYIEENGEIDKSSIILTDPGWMDDTEELTISNESS